MTLRKKIGRDKLKPLSEGEETLAQHLNVEKIKYQREYKFHPTRGWKFDFILGYYANIAIEVEGGAWGKSRHTSPKGFAADCVKYAEAAILGWRVLRFTTDQVKSGYALDCIKRAIV